MTFIAIEKLLESETGLDSNSIGRNVVQRVVKQHMTMSGIADIGGYYEKLIRDKGALQALIEDVTVPETWFFRDKVPFDLLAEMIRTEWTPPSRDKPLRILSVPCATGEEAYSIAMVLSGLGFDAGSVRIDAVDISKRVLARASAAMYGENSFRGDEGNYRDRFFDKTEDGYLLRGAVREMVNFFRGNMLADEFLAGTEMYDIIFCRNVMIYFSKELRDKAIRKLHRLLGINGLLFVGHAEASNLPVELFSPVRRAGAFAFRRKGAIKSLRAEGSQPISKSAANDGTSVMQIAGRRIKKKSGRPKMAQLPRKEEVFTAIPRDGSNAHSDPILDRVRLMADEGRLAEASTLCESFLEKNAVNADAHYLLGLIRQAEENEEDAGSYFRKAVYLNPRHYEALVHLAALSESQGNLVAAAVYRSRASRLVGSG